MEDLVYLIYTHEEYDDILQIHLKRLFEFFPSIPVAICSNNITYIQEKYGNTYKFAALYQYDNAVVYGERVFSVLRQINTKYVLFNADMNILTSHVNPSTIDLIIKKMDCENIDQVRLFVGGIDNPIFNNDILHPIEKGYYFSVNSAIWRTSTLLNISKKFSSVGYRQIEAEEIQSYAHGFKNYYISSIHDILCPEEGHYTSTHFPIIHVTYYGKWRNSPYHAPFINQYATEFNIDLQKRGTWF